MTLITLGLNHKTTPVEMRERLAFTPENLSGAVKSLSKLEGISEAAILSTCNRTELYCFTKPKDSNKSDLDLVKWFSQYHGFSPDEINDHLYLHRDAESIRHALSVASGLDSMVLGEPQILGQMKQAYAQANELGTMGTMLGKLFQHAFSVAKQVRTDTEIGSSPVSVAFAAVNLSKQIFGELNGLTALMIGAGETIELAAQHLHSKKIEHIIIANRTIERAQGLADKFDGEAIALQDIPGHLHQADIVISSTASPLPILGKGAVEKALKKRKHKPVFMVDIAVPRDVEQEVGELDDVFLYTVDDLQEIINENLQSRQQAAEKAEEIIDVQVQTFLDWQRSLSVVDIIREIRDHTEQLSQEVLDKAHKQIAQGKDVNEVLNLLARNLTNKFLHQPSIELRQASLDNRHDLIEYARSLLLESEDIQTKKK